MLQGFLGWINKDLIYFVRMIVLSVEDMLNIFLNCKDVFVFDFFLQEDK